MPVPPPLFFFSQSSRKYRVAVRETGPVVGKFRGVREQVWTQFEVPLGIGGDWGEDPRSPQPVRGAEERTSAEP